MPSDTELQANIKIASVRKVNRKHGVIFHPTLGYPIPPPIPLTVARRNARERNRVKSVNDSYECLKAHVPAAAKAKRMSKVDIIKHTIEYIQKLQELVVYYEETQSKDCMMTSNTFSYERESTFCETSETKSGFPSFDNDCESSTNSPSSESGNGSPGVYFQYPSSEPNRIPYNQTKMSSNSNKTYPYSWKRHEEQNLHISSLNTTGIVNTLVDDDVLDVIAEWQDS